MATNYLVRVDDSLKALELNLNPKKVGWNAQEGAHMRGFWGSTVSFFLAFMGWFALSPIAVDVARSIDICENQMYPPEEYPTRKAYLKFKKVNTKEPYCRFGTVPDADNPTDCADPPEGDNTALSKYHVEVLSECICSSGTHCANIVTYSSVGSVGVTIFVRMALGTLLEYFGPVNVQVGLLCFGAGWVALSGAIWSEWSFILIRTMIGCVGATFVTNQFWCSLLFAPSVVGTANATAAGWGNLGGGVTQIFIVWCVIAPFESIGMNIDSAWRWAMMVPSVMFLICAVALKLFCWDTPTAKTYLTVKDRALWDYVEVLKDYRIVIMIFQYSACFGAELVMNAQLATHFRTYFQLQSADASMLAGCFGLMNLFARSLGGIFSDYAFAKFGFRGRIWTQFISLFLEAVLLYAFACVDNSQPWYVALIALIGFSLFVQMAEGTSYGIVPFMNPDKLAMVSALVGAGGNLGAVIALWGIYNPLGSGDELLPFKVHAGYVLFWALMNVGYYWPDKGGMFCPPLPTAAERFKDKDVNSIESSTV